MAIKTDDNISGELYEAVYGGYFTSYSIGELEIPESFVYDVMLEYLNMEREMGNTNIKRLMNNMLKEHSKTVGGEGKSKVRSLVKGKILKLLENE